MNLTYNIRIRKTDVYKGSKTTTYRVRWTVDGKEWREPFKTSALATSFRSELMSAAKRGEAFNTETGRPISMNRPETTTTWYTFAIAYARMRWHQLSGNGRRNMVQALSTATLALLTTERGMPPAQILTTSMRQWAFNIRNSDTNTPPEEIKRTLTWLASNTRKVSALSEPETIRTLVAALGRKKDGTPAMPATLQGKRGIIVNALNYATEIGLLRTNPITDLKWKAPKSAHEVDKRVVVNPNQARLILAAVRAHSNMGRKLTAFFAVMYYSGLRPGEALHLRKSNLLIPEDGWGELVLTGSTPVVGSAWTDDGQRREHRQLKGRAPGVNRTPPCPPALTKLLHEHLSEFGTSEDGRLFYSTKTKKEIGEHTYLRVWHEARAKALTPEEHQSPLARRPYDLRHAAVSTWLNAGVPATQVAEWAGHSLAVLLQVYAKCLAGQQDSIRERVQDILGDPEEGA